MKNKKLKEEIKEKLKKFKLDKKKSKIILDLPKISSVVQIDFADINAILRNSKKIYVEMGEPSKVLKNLKKIKNPKKINAGLISIAGNEKVTLDQVKKIAERVCSRLKGDANIIWGARFNNRLKKTRLCVILTE